MDILCLGFATAAYFSSHDSEFQIVENGDKLITTS